MDAAQGRLNALTQTYFKFAGKSVHIRARKFAYAYRAKVGREYELGVEY